MQILIVWGFKSAYLNQAFVVQGPPQQTIYPIATQGFNYYASSAHHITPFSIILVILWAFLWCSLFGKRA